MTIPEVLDQYDFERSVLIGYYGGGNYGDELLMEVLVSLLAERKHVKHLTITYQRQEVYQTFHHEFGYPRITMGSMKQLLGAILHNKNIIIGGGGLWGLDVNLNIFVLSALLFVSRMVFRKRVFLLGVGYYNSTSRLGHISAWFAAKAATYIVARDDESARNFKRYTKHVGQDIDIAWQMKELDLGKYEKDLQIVEQRLPVSGKTLFVTLRRFSAHRQNGYLQAITALLAKNTDKPIIVALMEPADVDPAGYAQLTAWQKQYPNVIITDFSFNPVGLYLYFKQHAKDLALIAPQFHAIISASIAGVRFFPMSYDNKVTALLKQLGEGHIVPINELQADDIQPFIDAFYKGKA